MTTKNTEKINLLPQEILDQRKYELWYPWIASVAIIVLLLIGLLYIGSIIGLKAQEKEVEAIQTEIGATQKSANSLAKYEKSKKNYDARAKIVKSALEKRLDPYLCALAVTYYLPGTVSIEQMTFDAASGMTIKGVVEDSSKNPNDKDWKGVAQTIDNLEKASIIKDVWLSQGAMNDAYDNYEYYDKQVSAKIQNNYPDVVDQFTISGSLKLTLDSSKKATWTQKTTTTIGGTTK